MNNKVIKYILMGCAAFVVLALVVATAIPYHGQTVYGKPDPYNKNKKAVEYLRDYYYAKELGASAYTEKECPVADDWFSWIDRSFGPMLAYSVAESHLGIWGQLTDKEYLYVQSLPSGRHLTQTSKTAADLPEVSAVRYKVEIKQCFIGSTGWANEIYVQVSGDEVTGAPAQLQLGQEVVLLLSATTMPDTGKSCYAPVDWEHGIFSVDPQGKVYAFSNTAGASSYDGKTPKKLIKDIRKMRREMGLW